MGNREAINFIYVLGYGWSGSSAVVDFLKQYKDNVIPDIEFRLIKERYGLMNLEKALVDQWDPIETDIALKDFIWLTDKLNLPYKRFSLSKGLDYERKLGSSFREETNKFLNKLVKYKFSSNWYFYFWKMNKLQVLWQMIKKKISSKNYSELMLYAEPLTEDEFSILVKEYISNIFSKGMNVTNGKNVILDQGVPAHCPEYAFKYTDNSKVIIVDRDPRDIYVDLVNANELIGSELAKKDDVEMFVSWFKSLHYRMDVIKSDQRVLLIRFEDLVFNYDKSAELIQKYLGIDANERNDKCCFDPSKSAKNIGMWKKYKNQEVMSEIEKLLPEYCYE